MRESPYQLCFIGVVCQDDESKEKMVGRRPERIQYTVGEIG